MARPGLSTHRKFRRLSRALGSPILARGALELLWESAYECGDDYVGTADDLEALVGWSGEPGTLARALADAGAPEGQGFIEPIARDTSDVQRYQIHDLWHHAPDYVAKRRKRELERLQRVAPSVKRRRTAPNGGQRPPSRDRQTGVARTPSPAPSPSPSPAPSHAPSPAPAPPHEDRRAAAFIGSRLRVTKRMHDALENALGDAAASVDLLRRYPEWDAELQASGESIDAFPWLKVRAFAAAGLSDDVFTGGRERPITAEERKKAEQYRRSLGHCPHDPRCASAAACVGNLVRLWRAQEEGVA